MRTFADLRYEDCERPPDLECAYRLVVMACDISQGCLRRLPWEYGDYGLSQADQRVVDAVRASVSIPFFYKPTRLTGDDGRDCWLVDGAVLSRFPIAVFDVPPGSGTTLADVWHQAGRGTGTGQRGARHEDHVVGDAQHHDRVLRPDAHRRCGGRRPDQDANRRGDYRSELCFLAWRINEHLARWAMHKFKRFRGKYAKAMAWLQKVYQYKPRLFAHWQLIAFT